MTVFHETVLPDKQKEVIRKIAQFCTDHGYYLGGGTAIAIQLGHRRSIDLDWFTQHEELDPYAAAAEIRAHGVELEVTDVGHGALHVSIDGLGVSFIRYQYPHMGELVDCPELGCQLASLQDLVCMKITAATQRGERKDFYDLVAICSERMTLTQAIELYQRKYGIGDIGHVMMSLCYFDDAEADPPPELIAAPTWEEVQETLKAWVRELSGR